MTSRKLRLGVNVDHVATLRNARGGAFPDPLRAAQAALAAGADGITAHLREDRRHIDDVSFIKKSPDFREMIFDIQVFDLKNLTDIISRLRALPIVHKVERVIG